MKNINRSFSVALLFAAAVGFSSCDHKVYTETTVHEDGTLDKTIVVQSPDSTDYFFGLSKEKGWDMKAEPVDTVKKDKDAKPKLYLTFRKTFASSEKANEELAMKNDTLFHITSKFEKRFKWFYTYIYYSDTYHCINRMDYPVDDYVTPEDYAFIDRLPAEGKPISKADSLYLDNLHNKLFDVYGLRAIFERHYKIEVRLLKQAGLEERWLDTLNKHKEPIFQSLLKNKDVGEDLLFNDAGDDDFLLKVMDSLGIPYPAEKMGDRYDAYYQLEDAKTNFSNNASEGKYTHVINMPWTVVSTNADSLAGNRLQWNPPSLKFTLKDYTMYAESRKANYWAFIVTAVLLVFTGYLFLRKSKLSL
jgi:hypothetical protein